MSKLVWSLTTGLLGVLSLLIWVASTSIAAVSGFTAMVATTLLPGFAQAYWIWSLWTTTGRVPEPLSLLCAMWLALFAVLIYARHYAFVGERPV
jgi:hypothetical protein